MKIFLHTSENLTIEDLDDATTLEEIARRLEIPDPIAWREDCDDPLDLGLSVGEAVGDRQHVHVSRCRHITVTVHFAGRDKTHDFAPGTTIGRIRKWAVGDHGFDLPANERPKHEVGVCGAGTVADRDAHVGTLAAECALCLDLAPKDRFQG